MVSKLNLRRATQACSTRAWARGTSSTSSTSGSPTSTSARATRRGRAIARSSASSSTAPTSTRSPRRSPRSGSSSSRSRSTELRRSSTSTTCCCIRPSARRRSCLHGWPSGSVAVDPEVDEIAAIDEVEFDAVVGNPPYGARSPKYKRRSTRGSTAASRRSLQAGSIGTGDDDTYGDVLRERHRAAARRRPALPDHERQLSHARRRTRALRRHILDRCKIVEILLTDTKHFEGVSFQFAGMAITTLEKCSDARGAARERDAARRLRPRAEGLPEPARREVFGAAPGGVRGAPRDAVLRRRAARGVRGGEGVAACRRRRARPAGSCDCRRRALPRADRTIPALLQAPRIAESQLDERRARAGSRVRSRTGCRSRRARDSASTGAIRESSSIGRRNRSPNSSDVTRLPAGTPRKPRLQNRELLLPPGLTYSVVSSGRVSVRLMPEGWIFGHKGARSSPRTMTQRALLARLPEFGAGDVLHEEDRQYDRDGRRRLHREAVRTGGRRPSSKRRSSTGSSRSSRRSRPTRRRTSSRCATRSTT